MSQWDETDEEEEDEATKVSVTSPIEPIQASRDRAYFIVLSGSKVGEMFKIDRETLRFGRGEEADVRILDEGISRLHCEVRAGREAVSVVDLGSTNGTYCNGVRIDAHELADGDKLQLGETTILKFTYHDQLDETFQRRMYESALRDHLTGAYSKGYLMDRLDSEIRFALRHGTALSLLLLDLDQFKEINDDRGHLAGDALLEAFANFIRSSIRAEDVFGRYGGDEFAIVSRAMGRSDARQFAERLRAGIEGLEVPFEGGPIAVTCSIGVATMPDHRAGTAGELIAIADAALYRAKERGRNQVGEGE